MKLFDTRKRALKKVTASDGQKVRFYCCGPTVYGPAHIGNFRTFVLQDVFRRVIELGGMETCHVRNLTDVDDKTIRDSRAEGVTLQEFTARWTEKFHADCEALNCFPPHIEPSAVAHIPQQIKMIERLIENGHAYPASDGSVYFRISSFPEYGELSHLNERELDLGKTAKVRANADEYEKDSIADFVLWKAWRPEDGENKWQSPWGEGRPGWHLECSAMIEEYLGDTFDLHSGGVDLVFPHHENEIAQSRCACGGKFALHWFHITHLLVDGGKMSKSLGNMYTLADLAEKGFTPAEVRYVLIGGYYRRPLNFLLDSLSDARAALQRLARVGRTLEVQANMPPPAYGELKKTGPQNLGVFEPAWESLNDDLNTPEALGHIFSGLRQLDVSTLSEEEARKTYRAFLFVLAALGITLPSLDEPKVEIPDEIRNLAEQRWEAKTARDWSRADALRDSLAVLGWSIKDNKDGYELTRS